MASSTFPVLAIAKNSMKCSSYRSGYPLCPGIGVPAQSTAWAEALYVGFTYSALRLSICIQLSSFNPYIYSVL